MVLVWCKWCGVSGAVRFVLLHNNISKNNEVENDVNRRPKWHQDQGATIGIRYNVSSGLIR